MSFAYDQSEQTRHPTSRKTIVPDDTLDNSAGIDFPESTAVTVQAPRLLVHPYDFWPLPARGINDRGRSVWDPLLRLYSRSAHKRLLSAARLRVNESAFSNVRDAHAVVL